MLLPFDDLNNLSSDVADESYIEDGKLKYKVQSCVDYVTRFLMYCYISGIDNVAEDLACESAFNRAAMRLYINQKVAGETFTDRVKKYAENGDLGGILRVATTEGHRLYGQGQYDEAKAFMDGKAKTTDGNANAVVYKEWQTMEDEKVRFTHDFLQGQAVPLDALFFTIDGDSAYFPGGFSLPENNVNCRCTLNYSKR